MALFWNFLALLLLLIVSRGLILVSGATFTFINKCDYAVWPGILASAGSPKLDSTGFELSKGGSKSFQAPTGWSGRFWGRTGCEFDGSGRGSCATGDCGSGGIECNGAGATPPATLAEFTLGSGSQDFYDVSLVDGYNLPVVVEGSGGSGSVRIHGVCGGPQPAVPDRAEGRPGRACKSACGAFGTDEYCCSGAYNTPSACKPSMYSQLFKSACPKSYSYAYDDATSTFTCTGAEYTITFCPALPSLKSSSDSSSVATGTTVGGSGSDSGSDSGTIQQASFASSWLANLATGDSIRPRPLAFETAIVLVVSLITILSILRL